MLSESASPPGSSAAAEDAAEKASPGIPLPALEGTLGAPEVFLRLFGGQLPFQRKSLSTNQRQATLLMPSDSKLMSARHALPARLRDEASPPQAAPLCVDFTMKFPTPSLGESRDIHPNHGCDVVPVSGLRAQGCVLGHDTVMVSHPAVHAHHGTSPTRDLAS